MHFNIQHTNAPHTPDSAHDRMKGQKSTNTNMNLNRQPETYDSTFCYMCIFSCAVEYKLEAKNVFECYILKSFVSFKLSFFLSRLFIMFCCTVVCKLNWTAQPSSKIEYLLNYDFDFDLKKRVFVVFVVASSFVYMFGRDFSYSIEFSCHATLISMLSLSLTRYIYNKLYFIQ